jgi:hypothetical protein
MNSELGVREEAAENFYEELSLNFNEISEENHEKVNKFNQFSGGNLKHGFPDYEAGILSTRL